jgi:hypothetical protein
MRKTLKKKDYCPDCDYPDDDCETCNGSGYI